MIPQREQPVSGVGGGTVSLKPAAGGEQLVPGAADQDAPADRAVAAAAEGKEARRSPSRELEPSKAYARRKVPRPALNNAVGFRLSRGACPGQGGVLALCGLGRNGLR